jgi:hypothetical protein
MNSANYSMKRLFLWAALIAAGSSVIPLATGGSLWAQAIVLALVLTCAAMLGMGALYWMFYFIAVLDRMLIRAVRKARKP